MISGEDITERPLPEVHVSSQKMGIHEWSYDNDISGDKRYKVPHRDKVIALKDIRTEVELGEKRIAMELAEQFVLTVSERGFGKRTSSFGYRTTRRGGKGIVAMATGEPPGVAGFGLAPLLVMTGVFFGRRSIWCVKM